VNVLLLGATGMVGQGLLRECLRDPTVTSVTAISRRSTGTSHAKLREIVQTDLAQLAPHRADLSTIDVCFYSLGASAVGMTEAEYAAINYDLTLSIAQQLVRMNPAMTFCYVSGAGTDSSEKGRMMWARVKGRTENALLRCGFRAAYMFRPGAILPPHDIRSSTPWYNAIYAVLRPLHPLIRRISANVVTTTEQFGRAMIAVARDGYPTSILEMRDITRF
jgi:uncharacterized protein YbjT (DUF2867 family)